MGPGLFVLRWFSYMLALAGFVAALYMYEKVFLTVLHSQTDFLDMEEYRENLDFASWNIVGCVTLSFFGLWCQLMGEHLSAANIFLAIAICLLYAAIFAIVGCSVAVWLRLVFEKAVYLIWNSKQHKREVVASRETRNIEAIRQHAIVRSTIKHPFFLELKGFIKRTLKFTVCFFDKFITLVERKSKEIPFDKWKAFMMSKISRK